MMTVFQAEWMKKVVILIIPPESYSYVSSAIPIEIVGEDNMEGVFVSMNKPYRTAVESFSGTGIFEKIIFVDCASGLVGDKPCADRLIVVKNPSNLTELEININKGLKALPKCKFLIFDSLTTLLIYSELNAVTRFAHRLGVRMKSNKVTSLFLAVEQQTGREMLKSLSTMADRLIYFDKEQKGRTNLD